jgi:hypothetical protein
MLMLIQTTGAALLTDTKWGVGGKGVCGGRLVMWGHNLKENACTGSYKTF